VLTADEQPGFDAAAGVLSAVAALSGFNGTDPKLQWLFQTFYRAGFIAGGQHVIDGLVNPKPRVELAGGSPAPSGTAEQIAELVREQTPVKGGNR
jgi:hypothetical protein